jgi:hypothetical protein
VAERVNVESDDISPNRNGREQVDLDYHIDIIVKYVNDGTVSASNLEARSHETQISHPQRPPWSGFLARLV